LPEPKNLDAEIPLDPDQAQLALEQSLERINDALATLEEAQKTREEIFELVVSV